MTPGRYSIVVLALAFTGCHKEPASAKWIRISPADGRFSALFPETPQEKHERAAPQNTTFHQYSVSHSDGRAFHVLWNDYPGEEEEGIDFAKVMEELRKGFGISGKKIVAEKAISLGGIAGRELEVDVGGKLVQRVRLFLVRNRLYQVMTYVPAVEKDDAEVGEFLDGFSIIEASTKPEK